MDLSCITADHPEMKMMSFDAHTWMVRLALRKAVAAVQGIDNDEPSVVTLTIGEDTTSKDPKLAVKCDKSMPMDLFRPQCCRRTNRSRPWAGSKSRPDHYRLRRGARLRRASPPSGANV